MARMWKPVVSFSLFRHPNFYAVPFQELQIETLVLPGSTFSKKKFLQISISMLQASLGSEPPAQPNTNILYPQILTGVCVCAAGHLVI